MFCKITFPFFLSVVWGGWEGRVEGGKATSHVHHSDVLLLALLLCSPGSLSDKIQIITIIGNRIKAMDEIYNAIKVGHIIPCWVDVALNSAQSESFLRIMISQLVISFYSPSP